jgi:hypothetical protein
MTRKAVKRDLRQLMMARDELGIPLLVGSCGTSGTDAGVDWTAEICAEIAAEEGLTARVARVYSEQSIETLAPYLVGQRIAALAPAPAIDEQRLRECTHIVALLGFEPLAAAIDAGAEIVLSGRATDTAVLAAVPLMRGLPPALCWHAAKIAECGGLCTTRTRMGGVMLTIAADGFEVEPLHASNTCTVASVSAHLLYENANPFRLREPGVVLDTRDARYEQVNERAVRVSGATVEQMPYTLKLEGSGPNGYRTMAFVAIADPKIMAAAGRWLTNLNTSLVSRIQTVLGYGAEDYAVDFRAYGWNALNPAAARADLPPPREIGLMMLVTAPDQERASEIARFCNPYLLHFPLNADDPLPSFAFPYSPAEVEMGQVFEFKLNHVVAVDSPLDLSRVQLETVGQKGRHAIA